MNFSAIWQIFILILNIRRQEIYYKPSGRNKDENWRSSLKVCSSHYFDTQDFEAHYIIKTVNFSLEFVIYFPHKIVLNSHYSRCTNSSRGPVVFLSRRSYIFIKLSISQCLLQWWLYAYELIPEILQL